MIVTDGGPGIEPIVTVWSPPDPGSQHGWHLIVRSTRACTIAPNRDSLHASLSHQTTAALAHVLAYESDPRGTPLEVSCRITAPEVDAHVARGRLPGNGTMIRLLATNRTPPEGGKPPTVLLPLGELERMDLARVLAIAANAFEFPEVDLLSWGIWFEGVSPWLEVTVYEDAMGT